jgi:hypothetical protein
MENEIMKDPDFHELIDTSSIAQTSGSSCKTELARIEI